MSKLLVHLLDAHELVAADSNGLSDPYVKMRVGDSSWKKSKVIRKTLNPTWNESFVLVVPKPDDELEIRVFDHDTFLRDEAIGSIKVSLKTLEQGHEKELNLKLDGVKTGSIHISITALNFGVARAPVPQPLTKGPAGSPRSEHSSAHKLPMPVLHQSPRTPPAAQATPPLPSTPTTPVHAAAPPPATAATAQPVAAPPQPYPYPYAPQPYYMPAPYPPYPYPPPGAAYPPPGAPYPPPGAPYSPPVNPYMAPYAAPVAPASPTLGNLQEVKQVPIGDVYEFGKELGKGSFATVYEGMRIKDQQMVAIKAISKAKVSGDNVKLLRREVLNLLQLSHPHIMKLHEVYEDAQNFYLVLELIKGQELFDKIVKLGHYSEKDASHIMGQVLSAIAYLHSKGIAHRDLKPENLMSIGFGDAEVIKLADFGLSKNFGEEEMHTSCGSPLYVAPEILTGHGYTKAVDIWSLGVILYILLVGYPPFTGANQVLLYRQIMNNEWGFARGWEHISADAKDLVTKMMCADATKRLTAEQALEHPWIKNLGQLSTTPLPMQDTMKKSILSRIVYSN